MGLRTCVPEAPASLSAAWRDKEQWLGLALHQLFSPIKLGIGETYGASP
jgi:hypothetical protein